MNIISAKFIKGIIGTDPILYDGKFQVVFLGRSNVGKSTLINSLTGHRNLARSSSTPGRTVRMDFFLINDKYYFVDLPGYSYAKRSLEKREKIEKMIVWYVMSSAVKKRLLILIIDAKVGPTPYDLDVLKTLREERIAYIIVANKTDRLKTGQKEKQLEAIRRDSGNSEVLAFSSKEKEGRSALLQKISEYITGAFSSSFPRKQEFSRHPGSIQDLDPGSGPG